MTIDYDVLPEEAVVAMIASNSSIQSLTSGRIDPLKLPAKTLLPALTYQGIGTPQKTKIHGHRGLFPKARIQITIWGDTYTSVKQLAQLLDKEFDGFFGQVMVGTKAIQIHHCFTEISGEDIDSELNLFWTSIDLIIQYGFS